MKIEQDKRRFDFHDIGKEIKKRRKASGMTQEELAYIVDRAPRTIMYNENDGQHPSLNTFYQMVTMFDISVDQYFYPSQNRGSECRKRIDAINDDNEETNLYPGIHADVCEINACVCRALIGNQGNIDSTRYTSSTIVASSAFVYTKNDLSLQILVGESPQIHLFCILQIQAAHSSEKLYEKRHPLSSLMTRRKRGRISFLDHAALLHNIERTGVLVFSCRLLSCVMNANDEIWW